MSSHVYLLRHGIEPLVKIGKANDLFRRIKDFGIEDMDISGSFCIAVPSDKDARRLECALHKMFHQWRVGAPEAVSLTGVDDGSTEWFLAEHLGKMLEFIESSSRLLGIVAVLEDLETWKRHNHCSKSEVYDEPEPRPATPKGVDRTWEAMLAGASKEFAIFPATNYPRMQSDKCVPFKCSETDKPRYAIVSGVRRDVHRRFLDLVMTYCNPMFFKPSSRAAFGVNSAERLVFRCETGTRYSSVGFFFDMREMAEALFGDPEQAPQLSEIVEELRRIEISCCLENGEAIDSSSLCDSWLPDYKPGIRENFLRDVLIRDQGFEPKDFAGSAFMSLTWTYLLCLPGEIALGYRHAMRQILKMSPTAAGLARLVPSHPRFHCAPLERVLNAIDMPRGEVRRHDLDQMLQDDVGLLASVGIEIKETAPGARIVSYAPMTSLSNDEVWRSHKPPGGLDKLALWRSGRADANIAWQPPGATARSPDVGTPEMTPQTSASDN